MSKMKKYEVFSHEDGTLNKNVLETIQVGDLIKTEHETKPQRVYGVSDNYFVAAKKMFGKFCYSIYIKKPIGNLNNFYRGVDSYILGFYHEDAYNFENEDFVSKYLKSLEDKEFELSYRKSIIYKNLSIKRQ